jgi:hypothetical protein
MRVYVPMYEGDSIIHAGPVPGGDIASAWETAISKTSFVQSNRGADSVSESSLDTAALEQRARTARSAWVGSKLKSFYQNLVRRLERAGQSEMENYLAASQNLADLEERIRRYERKHQPDHLG